MKTPQNVQDYVKVYKNHLSTKLCKSACKNLKAIEWKTHGFYHVQTNEVISYEQELDISFADIPEKEQIKERIWFALERYILKDFSSFNPWWGGWAGYSSIRFNKYSPSTQMRLHCDHIHDLFDGSVKGIPILTILGSLNDDYEGGELMMFGDHKIELPTGSVVVFPSNFMFPHEVRPVKSGVRYSYVSWSW